MSYEFLKTVHFISLMFLFFSLIFIIILLKSEANLKSYKRLIYAVHGLSWIILFASAFGLVSVTGIEKDFPTWAKIKTSIWILLGISPVLFKKLPLQPYIYATTTVILISSAIYLAVYKPF